MYVFGGTVDHNVRRTDIYQFQVLALTAVLSTVVDQSLIPVMKTDDRLSWLITIAQKWLNHVPQWPRVCVCDTGLVCNRKLNSWNVSLLNVIIVNCQIDWKVLAHCLSSLFQCNLFVVFQLSKVYPAWWLRAAAGKQAVLWCHLRRRQGNVGFCLVVNNCTIFGQICLNLGVSHCLLINKLFKSLLLLLDFVSELMLVDCVAVSWSVFRPTLPLLPPEARCLGTASDKPRNR